MFKQWAPPFSLPSWYSASPTHPSFPCQPVSLLSSFFLACKNYSAPSRQGNLWGMCSRALEFMVVKPHPVAMIQAPSGVYLFVQHQINNFSKYNLIGIKPDAKLHTHAHHELYCKLINNLFTVNSACTCSTNSDCLIVQIFNAHDAVSHLVTPLVSSYWQ